MELRQCPACALVYNAVFDSEVMPYDDRYENRQNFSPIFVELMTKIGDDLAAAYDLREGAVLEVGCGKGAFLKTLCSRHHLRGVGFDTSCEEEGTSKDANVRFVRRYVTPEDVDFAASAVVCRHVIEHVPQVGEFLKQLHGIMVAGGARVAYIETPAWEWIVDQNAFWDVFYEHCNYFSMPTLAHLARRAGFQILRHGRIFGDQYQTLELAIGTPGISTPPGVAAEWSLEIFASRVESSRNALTQRLAQAGAARRWAIWGAGAKGVCLANTMSDPAPSFLIDTNPLKQGTFVPGKDIPVVAPDDQRIRDIAAILIANPFYEDEIRKSLAQHGFCPQVLTL
jgi:SAM-dependent methyltransferase